MSKIEEMIARLCPDGVEYRELGEIAELVRGNGLQKSDFRESGVGCIHYGQIYTYYGLFAHVTKSFVSNETANKLKHVRKHDIIVTSTSENIEDVCKPVVWLGGENIVTGGHAIIIRHKQDAKYLAYYLMSTDFANQKSRYARGAKVIDVSVANLAKTRIPVPPLEIQQEIVRVLDSFTELEAELEARRKQYEHYRDHLLSFDALSRERERESKVDHLG